MQSTLCCAYIPGQTVDIAGDTCINATRKVLNQAFGTDLSMIPARTGYVLDDIYNAHPKDGAGAQTETSEKSEE